MTKERSIPYILIYETAHRDCNGKKKDENNHMKESLLRNECSELFSRAGWNVMVEEQVTIPIDGQIKHIRPDIILRHKDIVYGYVEVKAMFDNINMSQRYQIQARLILDLLKPVFFVFTNGWVFHAHLQVLCV